MRAAGGRPRAAGRVRCRLLADPRMLRTPGPSCAPCSACSLLLPAKRLTVDQALAHPWLASLHDPADEPACPQARRRRMRCPVATAAGAGCVCCACCCCCACCACCCACCACCCRCGATSCASRFCLPAQPSACTPPAHPLAPRSPSTARRSRSRSPRCSRWAGALHLRPSLHGRRSSPSCLPGVFWPPMPPAACSTALPARPPLALQIRDGIVREMCLFNPEFAAVR